MPSGISSTQTPYQMIFNIKSMTTPVPLIDYAQAMNANPSSTINATIIFGETTKSRGYIKTQAYLRKTEARRNYVQKLALSQVCEEQMHEGNRILPACRNVTTRANFLDNYHILIQYHKVPQSLKDLVYKAFSWVRYVVNPYYVSENVISSRIDDGKLELIAEFTSKLKTVNVSIQAPRLSTQFMNMPIPSLVRPAVVIHPQYSMVHRLGHKLLRTQHYPTCVVDKTYATSFDNKTYPINLGKCWHVVVQSTHQPHYNSDREFSSTDDYKTFSILTHDVDSQQREVMIILGETVVTLQPSSGSPAEYFLVNGEKVRVTKDAMAHYEDKQGNTIVQVYKLPTGAFRLYTPEHGFEVIYDGLRIKIQAPNDYRGEVRGLCGTFDGETVTDFTTPKNCILKNPFQFAATYAVPESSCQGPTNELREQAQTADCYKKIVTLGNFINFDRAKLNSSFSGKIPIEVKPSGVKICRVTHATYMIQLGGKHCFSKKPVGTCHHSCRKNQINAKSVDFYCLVDSTLARHFADLIRKGANPDFSKRETTISWSVDTYECSA